jgi:pimeloyl-ACP methyl ester carboxylesterase
MKKWPWIAAFYALAGAALTAKLVSRPRDVAWEDYADTLPHAEHSRFVAVDGARIHFQEMGAAHAPPVVLLHGFCSSGYIWADVMPLLAEAGFRVIAPDLVGYGFSGKPPYAEYTIQAQARMVLRLLNRLGIGRATLIGSSYGGAVAATCALDAPERVDKLVLVGAVSNDNVPQQRLLQMAAWPVIGDLLSPVMLDSRPLMRWRMSQVYAPENARLTQDAARMEGHHRPLRAAATHRAVINTLRRWSATRIAREAHLIRQPTLLLWGENDQDVPLREGWRLFHSIPDSRLIVFHRCGHIPHEEYPAQFAEIVSGFLHQALPYTRTEAIAEGSKIRAPDSFAEDEMTD